MLRMGFVEDVELILGMQFIAKNGWWFSFMICFSLSLLKILYQIFMPMFAN